MNSNLLLLIVTLTILISFLIKSYYAGELKALLMEELGKSRRQNDVEHEKELDALIKILDSYILGQIDLMIHPDDLMVSNLT